MPVGRHRPDRRAGKLGGRSGPGGTRPAHRGECRPHPRAGSLPHGRRRRRGRAGRDAASGGDRRIARGGLRLHPDPRGRHPAGLGHRTLPARHADPAARTGGNAFRHDHRRSLRRPRHRLWRARPGPPGRPAGGRGNRGRLGHGHGHRRPALFRAQDRRRREPSGGGPGAALPRRRPVRQFRRRPRGGRLPGLARTLTAHPGPLLHPSPPPGRHCARQLGRRCRSARPRRRQTAISAPIRCRQAFRKASPPRHRPPCCSRHPWPSRRPAGRRW